MIAVYAVCHVKADKIAEFEALAQNLIRASLNDQGCISYGCGAVRCKVSRMFILLWNNGNRNKIWHYIPSKYILLMPALNLPSC